MSEKLRWIDALSIDQSVKEQDTMPIDVFLWTKTPLQGLIQHYLHELDRLCYELVVSLVRIAEGRPSKDCLPVSELILRH